MPGMPGSFGRLSGPLAIAMNRAVMRSPRLVETDRDDQIRARFVILAGGPLSRPKLPGIPGIESFKGHSFHTSRWDYGYTGGNSNGGLVGLKDKRVGIIGTGATAVQCVPHLGEWAKELYVFQRTPSSIDVRNNRPTDPDWAKRLEPGWQQERMDNFNVLVSGGFADKDLVNDGWTDIIGNILLLARKKMEAGETVENPAALMQLADFKKMEQVRSRVDSVVQDPAKAEALKPWYNQFCKRPCFHDEYLATFNRPNVTLVDTKGRGVERITETAIVANGKAYEVDCLIYATGFEVGTDYTRRSGYELHGRGGLTLTQKWKNGAETLHGLLSRGFPNCFIISNVQSGFSANFPHMINEQSRHVAYVIKNAVERQARTVEPSQEAEDAWVDTIVKLSVMREQFLAECTPGYYNNEGKVELMNKKNSSYGAGPVAFTKVLEDWRVEGSLKGLELAP
jgi:cyclohexanone monooxygenase